MTSPTTPTTIGDAAVEQATDRWHAIATADTTNPAQQARVDAAARLADAAIATAARAGWARPGTAGPDVVDASQTWAGIALLWHQVLTDTDAFTNARNSPHTTCHLDVDAIRAWLTGPDREDTVAATLGLDEYFDLYGFDKFDRLTRLVAAAQDAGVFGVDGHRVELLHEAGDHGYVDAHRTRSPHPNTAPSAPDGSTRWPCSPTTSPARTRPCTPSPSSPPTPTSCLPSGRCSPTPPGRPPPRRPPRARRRHHNAPQWTPFGRPVSWRLPPSRCPRQQPSRPLRGGRFGRWPSTHRQPCPRRNPHPSRRRAPAAAADPPKGGTL